MKTVRTQDRIYMDWSELQQLLKDHIRIKSGRIVDGDVCFSKGADGFSCYAHLVEKTRIEINNPAPPGVL